MRAQVIGTTFVSGETDVQNRALGGCTGTRLCLFSQNALGFSARNVYWTDIRVLHRCTGLLPVSITIALRYDSVRFFRHILFLTFSSPGPPK